MPISQDDAGAGPTGANDGRRTTMALETQQAFLRQVIDINPNLVFAKDREGHFTLVNQAVAQIYGTTVEQLIGKTDADFNDNAEEVAFFRRMDLEVMNSLQQRVIAEEIITDAKGKLHYLQTVKRPIVGPNGVADQVLGVATDITERKQLEEQLRHAQKMEALGQLAGGIAHDFNNLLAVVLGNAELMLQRLRKKQPTDDRLETSLELIVTSAKRAESLTRQLLAFSRRQTMNPVVLDFNDVLKEMENLLRRVIGEHIELVVNPWPHLLCVKADPGHMEQILMNLVVNARDAMPSGGTLTIETSEVMLDADYTARRADSRVGRHVLLRVSDTGAGMSQQTMRRIFEPFFTTKPVGQGTGLGLSTVYGIVKQVGGHVHVESEVGHGSTFHIYLPADSGTPQKTANEHGVELALRGHETILVCEDEEQVLRLICQILEDSGYQVLVAKNGSQALERAAGHKAPIDLLLTDVVMPEMNGRQLVERMIVCRPEIKVLYMTGFLSDALLAQKQIQDEVNLISKPFTPKNLLVRVRDALDVDKPIS